MGELFQQASRLILLAHSILARIPDWIYASLMKALVELIKSTTNDDKLSSLFRSIDEITMGCGCFCWKAGADDGFVKKSTGWIQFPNGFCECLHN